MIGMCCQCKIKAEKRFINSVLDVHGSRLFGTLLVLLVPHLRVVIIFTSSSKVTGQPDMFVLTAGFPFACELMLDACFLCCSSHGWSHACIELSMCYSSILEEAQTFRQEKMATQLR